MIKKKIVKFGKSFSDLDKIKQDLYYDNSNLLEKQNKIKKIYLSQPRRKKCKACNVKLNGYSFINHGIKYIECKNCGHVNGNNQDSKTFVNKIYISKKTGYSKNYYEKNVKKFILRQRKIYDPKAKFLKNVFLNHKNVKVLDVGAGSGYFVSSLIDVGFKDVKGLEVSKDQVKFGKTILKKLKKNQNKLENLSYENILKYIEKTNFNCISLMGVLEHLVDMSVILKSIKKNKSIKYIYLQVPMFSFSCIFENIFEKVFNRHLGGGHTHLFTEKSLLKFMKKFGFKEHSAWWFGTDFSDLYRSIIVTMKNKNYLPLYKKITELKSLIDKFQFELDRKKMSTLVHMGFKR